MRESMCSLWLKVLILYHFWKREVSCLGPRDVTPTSDSYYSPVLLWLSAFTHSGINILTSGSIEPFLTGTSRARGRKVWEGYQRKTIRRNGLRALGNQVIVWALSKYLPSLFLSVFISEMEIIVPNLLTSRNGCEGKESRCGKF